MKSGEPLSGKKVPSDLVRSPTPIPNNSKIAHSPPTTYGQPLAYVPPTLRFPLPNRPTQDFMPYTDLLALQQQLDQAYQDQASAQARAMEAILIAAVPDLPSDDSVDLDQI